MTALASPLESAGPSTTSVLLVDDHELLTGALQLMLEREPDLAVCGTAATIEAALAAAARWQPGLIIADQCLPDGEIHEHLDRFALATPGVRLLVVTGWPSEHSFLACVRAGAAGYVSKTRPPREVVDAAIRVAGGEAVFPAEYLPVLLGRDQPSDSPGNRLTARELDVLQALAHGRSTAEVARDLFISVNTVRNHLANAMAKLEKRSRLAAVSEAVRLGLISPSSSSQQTR